MKAPALAVLAATVALACSSDPQPANPGGGGGGAGPGASGATSTSAGSPGSSGSNATGGGAGAATGGGGGTSGAATTGGNPTTAGASGSGGTLGASGSGGVGGSGGLGGSTGPEGGRGPEGGYGGGGNLPSMIPAGYVGTPFGGTPQTIPGKIEIEKYDLGGAGVAYQADAGGAFNKCGFTRPDAIKLQCTQQEGPDDKTLPGCGVEPEGQIYLGYIVAGNWYKYTVNVLEAGTYVISGHEGVAGNTQMQFTFTEAMKTGNLTLPSTNQCNNYEAYHVWAVHDNLGEIALTPGKYVLTINVVAAAMNLDWFAFTKK